jgi:DNA-binding NarL/FixJ family response regulator
VASIVEVLADREEQDPLRRMNETPCAARMVLFLARLAGEMVRRTLEPDSAGSMPDARKVAVNDSPQLTPRQSDVYRAAARGLSNKSIARELGIAESTVKTHLTSVFAVLGVRNRTEAAYRASRPGTAGAPDTAGPGHFLRRARVGQA